MSRSTVNNTHYLAGWLIAGLFGLRCCGCRSLDNVNMQNGGDHDVHS